MTIDMDTYVIGDIHGRADLLRRTLEQLEFEALMRPHRVVFLGDVIDRGPDTRGALDLVRWELKRQPASILLRGNHEDLMLRFAYTDFLGSNVWLNNGGVEALLSYGYQASEIEEFDAKGNWKIRDGFKERFVQEQASHFEIIQNSANYVEIGDYILVHAGINPSLPLTEQDPYWMKWTKETPDHTCLGNKTVIHGHVITQSGLPEVYDNRIAIDTGAYNSGRLTTVQIFAGGTGLSFFSASINEMDFISFREIDPVDFRTGFVPAIGYENLGTECA